MLLNGMKRLQGHPKAIFGGVLLFVLALVLYGSTVLELNGNSNFVSSKLRPKGPITFDGNLQSNSEAFDDGQEASKLAALAKLNGAVNNRYSEVSQTKLLPSWMKTSGPRSFGSLKNSRLNFKKLAGSHSYARARVLAGTALVSHTNTSVDGLEEVRVSDGAQACILVYVKDPSDISDLKRTMESVEANFNRKYQYPWVIVAPVNHFPTQEISEIASGFVRVAFVPKLPLDTQVSSLKSAEDPVVFSSDEFTKKKELKFEYYRKLQQLRSRESDSALQLEWELYQEKNSKLYNPSSISLARFLSSDVFSLNVLTPYDYFLKIEEGTVFDCEVKYDIFERFRDDSSANVGVVFMDKTLDPRLTQTFNTTLGKVQDEKNVKLSHYFADDNNHYNGVVVDTETFLVGKTAFFNTKQYLSFIRYMDKMRLEFSEPWSASEIMTAYFALIYNEVTPRSDVEGETSYTLRKDLMVFDDLAISNLGMFDSKLKNTPFEELKTEKYILTKQSCPISTTFANEVLLKNILRCNCDVDDRFFHSGVDLFKSLDDAEITTDFLETLPTETLFTEFHELVLAQMRNSILRSGAEQGQLLDFEQYFEQFSHRQIKSFTSIRTSRIDTLELLESQQEERVQDLKEGRGKKAKDFFDNKKKHLDQQSEKLDQKRKELEEAFKEEERRIKDEYANSNSTVHNLTSGI
ncbi:unnamed protein product [Kluyveromyces dobzhanskii CBS 2104]|uniref:WGS project CCBQ000000000 data, contig 00009 n=1 Tax=Kluyveromyces dobzhanskii CBS 2104 TaxID=1427455 RepID=A0A0A8L555_9SACH|nr:unnamed protein product [Kluyveromyces dobzhanskii CBS 2104]